jgi:hypothetical protein
MSDSKNAPGYPVALPAAGLACSFLSLLSSSPVVALIFSIVGIALLAVHEISYRRRTGRWL